jgi:hypothetical protein
MQRSPTLVVLIVLVGCGGHGATSASDSATTSACATDFQAALDRTCETISDCVLVHSTDCCGTVVVGIAATSEAMFASVEATYETCLACGARGCQHADLAEDGGAPGPGETIIATCDNKRCKAVTAGTCAPSTSCAGPTCGTSCCSAGERCEAGTCRCGNGSACGAGDTCASGGPMGSDSCGAICCGASGPCPG